jgi:hypothetical protein
MSATVEPGELLVLKKFYKSERPYLNMKDLKSCSNYLLEL